MAPTRNTAVKGEQSFASVSDAIQTVFDLTSRIDERVKMLITHQNEIDLRLEKLLDMHQQILHRITAIESKNLNAIEDDLQNLNEKVAILENDDCRGEIQELKTKIHSFDLKQENITLRIGSHDGRWNKIFDSIWKFALMLIAGFILYKLGFQSPPN